MHQERRSTTELIDLACSKLKDEDYTHKGFLQPLEIALKTYKTELHSPEDTLKPDSLANGLKIVIKESINDNKYTLNNFRALE